MVKAGDTNIKHLAYGDKWEKGLSEYLKMLAVRLYLMKDLLADDGLIGCIWTGMWFITPK